MPLRSLVLSALLVLLLVGAPVGALAEDGADPSAAPAASEKERGTTRRPLLWMVEGTPRVFLYGTIHVADERVTKHLPVVQAAFDQSTAVYTELQMDAAGMQQMQMSVMVRSALPEGKTLTGLLGEELHARVGKVMPASVPLFALENRKPWMIQFVLLQSMMETHAKLKAARAKAAGASDETVSGTAASGQALDPLLYAQAQEAGKQVGGLETIDTQLDVFDGVPLEGQVAMVEETVAEIEKMQRLLKELERGEAGGAGSEEEEVDAMTMLLDLWLAGDDQGFLKLFEEDLRKQGGQLAESFVEGLLDKRNVGMVAKIRELMKSDPKQTYFIAVGAGHMPGEQGVVKLLEKQGLTVTRLERGAKLPPLAAPKEPAKEPAGAGAGG